MVPNVNALTTGTVVVIGTIFKEMPLKPSVLDEFSFEVRRGGASCGAQRGLGCRCECLTVCPWTMWWLVASAAIG